MTVKTRGRGRDFVSMPYKSFQVSFESTRMSTLAGQLDTVEPAPTACILAGWRRTQVERAHVNVNMNININPSNNERCRA